MSTSNVFPNRPPPLTLEQVDSAFEKLLKVQEDAVAHHSKRPFAAFLLAPDNETILLTHFSIDHVNHAESCLARLAAIHYSQAYLWQCTLVTTWEPCAMCAGTIYWANIGRVIYAAREEKLAELTGFDNAENFTMSLSCREVLARGQKDIKVGGPHEEWEDIVVNSSDEYWKPRREQAAKEVHPGTQGPIIWNISSD